MSTQTAQDTTSTPTPASALDRAPDGATMSPAATRRPTGSPGRIGGPTWAIAVLGIVTTVAAIGVVLAPTTAPTAQSTHDSLVERALDDRGTSTTSSAHDSLVQQALDDRSITGTRSTHDSLVQQALDSRATGTPRPAGP